MKCRITWLKNGFVQYKTLVRCKLKDKFFTLNSPIYKAIEDGTYYLDLGYGKQEFKIEEINE
jgi:hypothetical protein